VIPDDVKSIAVQALSHRLILKSGPWLAGLKAEKVIEDIISKTPIPKATGR
jgi:MoxR-like ATPase